MIEEENNNTSEEPRQSNTLNTLHKSVAVLFVFAIYFMILLKILFID